MSAHGNAMDGGDESDDKEHAVAHSGLSQGEGIKQLCQAKLLHRITAIMRMSKMRILFDRD